MKKIIFSTILIVILSFLSLIVIYNSTTIFKNNQTVKRIVMLGRPTYYVYCKITGGEYNYSSSCGFICGESIYCGYQKAEDGGKECIETTDKNVYRCMDCSLGREYSPPGGQFGQATDRCIKYKKILQLFNFYK